MMACRRVFAVNTVVMYLCLCIHQAFAQSSPHLMGDVGVAMYKTPALTRATSQMSTALPYIYADYGPIYARVDTFGYRLAPMGLGHLFFMHSTTQPQLEVSWILLMRLKLLLAICMCIRKSVWREGIASMSMHFMVLALQKPSKVVCQPILLAPRTRPMPL